jgi:hypothetical protein
MHALLGTPSASRVIASLIATWNVYRAELSSNNRSCTACRSSTPNSRRRSRSAHRWGPSAFVGSVKISTVGWQWG